jgi:hypothetical protein
MDILQHSTKYKQLISYLPVCYTVADVLLWKNLYLSGGILGGVFFAYILFEWSGYTLLSLIANVLLILVSALFIWSYAASLLNR